MSLVRHRLYGRALRAVTVFVAALAVVLGGLAAPATAAAPSQTGVGVGGAVKTANLANFNPGNIISDAVFFNRSTMSEGQVQAFLEARVPTCQSGYTCLRDWYDTTRATAADAMCGAYAGGGRERASTIIYKVAQSCGINPQVILATLQKEQSLVTHTWPSTYRYTSAMGQGCPDTAACDTRYYGFFNQVYGAAWQFKRYANPPGTSNYFTWYAPGKTWNIRWHPNADCGSSPVYVQNQATANLYYYTPYQPNAAAIRAGYGTGDGCSSYGNRNFYQYFTDWFGSGQRDPAAEIDAEYRAQGGEPSLGAPTSGIIRLSQNGGGFARAYAAASIYWTAEFGAKTVRSGPIMSYYFGRSGADGDVGWPMLNQQGIGTAGIAQVFTGGSVYSGGKGTFIVREPLRAGYFGNAGADGPLGWPVEDQRCASGVCTQSFENGRVVSSARGAFGLLQPVLTAYDAAGGPGGAWGVPLSHRLAIGAGFGQAFANASAYYLPGGTPIAVAGATRDHYFSLGGALGRLGFPTGLESCSSSTDCRQEFEFGWIIRSAQGARVGDPAIDAVFAAQPDVVGQRIGTTVYYAANGGGLAEGFSKAPVYHKRGTAEAFAVPGAVRDFYFAMGGAAGSYGWPTSPQACSAGSCTQRFDVGDIVSSASGTFGVQDPLRQPFREAGGPAGPWGVPLSSTISISANGGGAGQVFAAGSVYRSTSGAPQLVSDAIRDHYFSLRGAEGPLGFPVGAQQCVSGACQQEFQFGWILWSSTGGARVGDPFIDAAYAASGGESGTLGKRTSGILYYGKNGGGFAQAFAGGAIYHQRSASAAYAVTGIIRDKYFATGGAEGVHGWPVSDAQCADGVCQQQFEGGQIAG